MEIGNPFGEPMILIPYLSPIYLLCVSTFQLIKVFEFLITLY